MSVYYIQDFTVNAKMLIRRNKMAWQVSRHG